jgi:hypothetical protein
MCTVRVRKQDDLLPNADAVEEDLDILEEDSEDAVTDLHGRTQDNGHILHVHLVLCLLYTQIT